MPDDPRNIPPEALAAARAVVQTLHERLAAILEGMPQDAPSAVDVVEEQQA